MGEMYGIYQTISHLIQTIDQLSDIEEDSIKREMLATISDLVSEIGDYLCSDKQEN